MDQATRIYSPEKGFHSEIFEATSIKSHSHARKLAPFVDGERSLVYWVNWGKLKSNGKPRVAHFRHYPKNNRTVKEITSKEVSQRYFKSKESSNHIRAKESVQTLLENLLANKKHLPWAFKDPEISDFPMSGDFLAGAVSIEKEYPIVTPLGTEYRLDVAILGKTISNQPIVLAGIEIEFTHRFDFSKSLLCKTLGFPLISIDITDTDVDDIGVEWAKKALMETTHNSEDGFRRNYIYIHRMLSTVYIDIPRELHPESKHQYVIFSKEQDRLISYLKKLKLLLKLSDKQVSISPITDKNHQLHKQVINAGNLAGDGWGSHSSKSFVQLTLEKPINKSGDLYYFHLTLARLCNAFFDCLVGYKYEPGHSHEIGDPLYWRRMRKINNEVVHYQIAPKRVSEPVFQILNQVNKSK